MKIYYGVFNKYIQPEIGEDTAPKSYGADMIKKTKDLPSGYLPNHQIRHFETRQDCKNALLDFYKNLITEHKNKIKELKAGIKKLD